MLDYQTDMGNWGVWQQYYSKPDPAFILPWYGFSDPNDPIPPASPELKLYSYDIQVTPPYASAGDTVTISATVRNFSNQLAQNVKIRFYQGYPAGTNLIGEATIPQLNRPAGPQTVSITWTASGVGDQKIYAVIDPTDAIDEVHDTGDLIDNNIAYGRLRIGAAAYGDMGLASELAYQSQSYTQTNSLIVSAYTPPGNLDEITLFELKDAILAVESVIGNPFELAANPGSLDWNAEEDFSLRSNVGDPPAVIAIAYDDADIAGVNEANLRLFRRSTYGGWQEATCAGYTTVRFPEDNLIAVPVCQAGTFALSAETPVETWSIFLPLVLKGRAVVAGAAPQKKPEGSGRPFGFLLAAYWRGQRPQITRHTKPLRYSDSGSVTRIGWSLAWPSFSTICTSRSASSEALKMIFWNRSGETRPEHENVTRMPPGPQDVHRHPVNVLVAARGALELLVVLRELGRVEDDGVEHAPLGAKAAQLGKHIAHDVLYMCHPEPCGEGSRCVEILARQVTDCDD